jgi:YD repeat-containing protein
MSTTTMIELAVEAAERFMAKNGYASGTCLGARLTGESMAENWEVEFAYDGLEDRSQTTDPPSIVLLVNLKTEEVSTAELM